VAEKVWHVRMVQTPVADTDSSVLALQVDEALALCGEGGLLPLL
jgi:hypothetical protein